MKRRLAGTLGAVMLLAGVAGAEYGGGPGGPPHDRMDRTEMKERMEEKAGDRAEKLKERLNLTPEQAQRVEAALRKQSQAKMEIMKAHREKMEAIHKDFDAELGTILTPEQKEKYEEKMSRRGRRKHHR